MKFRPCIDLHQGKVKQIVGSSFSEDGATIRENFVADRPSEYFAKMYREDGLSGGHVICLGTNEENQNAAEKALKIYPEGLQIGGGVNDENAQRWLECGAAKVILTSFVFGEGRFKEERLDRLAKKISPEKITLDLSCSRFGSEYRIMSDRWQTDTGIRVEPGILRTLSQYCSEFLIHAVDSEGKSQGPDETLLKLLSEDSGRPVVYAGGIRNREDLDRMETITDGKVDFTVGSALDIFGGNSLSYRDLVLRYGQNPQ